VPQNGRSRGREQVDRATHQGECPLEAPSPGALHGQSGPGVESKAADIIGLYLNPPQHAAVFCVDEKTAIQALDRKDRRLPLSPGRAERQGFEYYRHGTLSLYAALNVKSGKVEGRTAARHTSAEFVKFLTGLVRRARWAREIHVILDNLSAHKTPAVEAFLETNPKVKFHFTPTYSSWLNQVEIWFAKIERQVIARGVFTSVTDLARKLCRYINVYSTSAQPIRWKYSDVRHRVRTNDLMPQALSFRRELTYTGRQPKINLRRLFRCCCP
jgi:transposase